MPPENLHLPQPCNVLSVLFGPFPPDIRVEKVAGTLLDHGCNVRVLAQPGPLAATRWAGRVNDLYAVSPLLRKLDTLRNKALSRLNPPFLAGQAFAYLLSRAVQAHHIHLIHWNDLGLAHIGLQVARRAGCAFVLDLHENYPYNMWSTGRDLGIVARRYSLSEWLAYEKYIVERADLVLTSVREMNERLHGMHGVSHSGMVEFLNTEDPAFWAAQPDLPTLLDSYTGRDIVVYCGSCSIHRGLDVIIEAVDLLRQRWPALLFVIVGDGHALPSLRQLVARRGLAGHVLFLGHRPFHEMASYMRRGFVGVVPHHKYGQTDNTVPHKLFQYMCLERPVLVSSCACLRRLVEESQSGLVFQAGNPVSAAECLLRLRDSRLQARLGQQGRAAVAGPFHLRHQQRRLLRAIARLLAHDTKGSQ